MPENPGSPARRGRRNPQLEQEMVASRQAQRSAAARALAEQIEDEMAVPAPDQFDMPEPTLLGGMLKCEISAPYYLGEQDLATYVTTSFEVNVEQGQAAVVWTELRDMVLEANHDAAMAQHAFLSDESDTITE